MKNLLKEEGLAKASKWYLWTKVLENLIATIFLVLITAFFVGSIVWLFKQISLMGW